MVDRDVQGVPVVAGQPDTSGGGTGSAESADAQGGGPTSEPMPSGRAARTRRAVVEALLTLLDEGNLRPTAREVADKAEVSLRSVYVHFDDVEALFLAAAIRHQERMREVRGELVVTGTFDERLEAFVERRSRSYEVGANVRRAAVIQEPFSPALREVLAFGRAILHNQVDEVFAAELAELGGDERAFQRQAAILASSPAAWDEMRLRQKLEVEEAEAVMRKLIRTVLVAGS